MSESHSHSNRIEQQDDYQPELTNIPQISSFQEKTTENPDRYMRILGRDQKIDEEGILQQYLIKKGEQEKNKNKNSKISIPTGKKVKPQKLPQAPSKKYDFGYIKKKWKAQIDANIERYKQYLKQEKQGYTIKEKEFMLDFFKILLDGIFQLKDYAESQFNDLTNNELKIIAKESDQCLWLTNVVNNFDKEFKEAKYNQKIESTALKWKSLIKYCMDENNFQLRRKIIRCKIKPIHVIENNDTYLMSQEAKLQEERRKKLILAEADMNFQKPYGQEENNPEPSYEQNSMANLPEQMESMRSISHNQNLEKKINEQRQKLQEYKQAIGPDNLIRLKSRIEELVGTSSYQILMEDYAQTFQAQ